MNQAMKGDPQHKSVHQGRTYHFANADAKKLAGHTALVATFRSEDIRPGQELEIQRVIG